MRLLLHDQLPERTLSKAEVEVEGSDANLERPPFDCVQTTPLRGRHHFPTHIATCLMKARYSTAFSAMTRAYHSPLSLIVRCWVA